MIIGAYAFPTGSEARGRIFGGLLRILKEVGNFLDLIVAPQYANISMSDLAKLNAAVNGSALIPGTRFVYERKKLRNRALLLRQGDYQVWSYDKRVLSPDEKDHVPRSLLQ